jgi:hypothetical protein
MWEERDQEERDQEERDQEERDQEERDQEEILRMNKMTQFKCIDWEDAFIFSCISIVNNNVE